MQSQDFRAEIEVATRLARRAGEVILKHYAAGVDVDYKDRGHSDPVTAADRDANELIVAGLCERFPQDGVLAEESPAGEERLSRRRLWCVDPLDGTREFLEHNGQFVVMIGLAVDGEARLGVVYQPTEDRLMWGAAGEAWIEERGARRRLEPSRRSEPASAVMVVSRSHRSQTVSRVAASLGIIREEPLGSVGLKATRIAGGTADVYLSVSNRTHEWDACAPEAIVRAAGGLMTDCRGDPLRYNKPTTETPFGMLATNGALHSDCVRALQPIAAERGWG